MNWTGGNLSRHSKKQGSDSLAQRQRQHFARARANLHNAPQQSPGDFVPDFLRGDEPTDLRQSRLEEYSNVAPIVARLRSMRSFPQGSHQSSLRKLQDRERTNLPIDKAAPVMPHERSRSRGRVSAVAAPRVQPAMSERPSAARATLDDLRRRLLSRADWVGLHPAQFRVSAYTELAEYEHANKRKRVLPTPSQPDFTVRIHVPSIKEQHKDHGYLPSHRFEKSIDIRIGDDVTDSRWSLSQASTVLPLEPPEQSEPWEKGTTDHAAPNSFEHLPETMESTPAHQASSAACHLQFTAPSTDMGNTLRNIRSLPYEFRTPLTSVVPPVVIVDRNENQGGSYLAESPTNIARVQSNGESGNATKPTAPGRLIFKSSIAASTALCEGNSSSKAVMGSEQWLDDAANPVGNGATWSDTDRTPNLRTSVKERASFNYQARRIPKEQPVKTHAVPLTPDRTAPRRVPDHQAILKAPTPDPDAAWKAFVFGGASSPTSQEIIIDSFQGSKSMATSKPNPAHVSSMQVNFSDADVQASEDSSIIGLADYESIPNADRRTLDSFSKRCNSRGSSPGVDLQLGGSTINDSHSNTATIDDRSQGGGSRILARLDCMASTTTRRKTRPVPSSSSDELSRPGPDPVSSHTKKRDWRLQARPQSYFNPPPRFKGRQRPKDRGRAEMGDRHNVVDGWRERERIVEDGIDDY